MRKLSPIRSRVVITNADSLFPMSNRPGSSSRPTSPSGRQTTQRKFLFPVDSCASQMKNLRNEYCIKCLHLPAEESVTVHSRRRAAAATRSGSRSRGQVGGYTGPIMYNNNEIGYDYDSSDNVLLAVGSGTGDAYSSSSNLSSRPNTTNSSSSSSRQPAMLDNESNGSRPMTSATSMSLYLQQHA